jgi:hypothetical protein
MFQGKKRSATSNNNRDPTPLLGKDFGGIRPKVTGIRRARRERCRNARHAVKDAHLRPARQGEIFRSGRGLFGRNRHAPTLKVQREKTICARHAICSFLAVWA